MPSATRVETAPARSLADVHEPAVKDAIDRMLAHPASLGFLIVGSRAIGWAAPDGDYDGFWLVTREHYRSLDVDQTQIRIFADGETPPRMIGDISIFSEDVLEAHLTSPLDIDHWPYVDAVMIADPSGRLSDWRQRLAAFPEVTRRERAIHKYLDLAIAHHYATLADVRGFEADRQLNLFRGALAAVNLWFTLRGRWAPPLKWWTREVERLEIRPDTRGILEGAIVNPTIETLTHARDHLRSDMRHAGITEVDQLLRAFFETFLPERRAAVYRDSYL